MSSDEKVLYLLDVLKRIKRYKSPEWLRSNAMKEYGLDNPDEAIEMAYENIRAEAATALVIVRRPRP